MGGVHPIAVGVAARQLLERGLLLRVVGVAGEGGDVVAARDVLQLHAGAEHPEQGSGLVDRQVGVPAAVRDDRQVLPGVEAEPGDDPADEVDAVAREHAQVVARPVAAGAARSRCGGWSARRACRCCREQLAVPADRGGPGVVGDDDGVADLAVGEGDRQPGTGGRGRLAHRGRQAERAGEVGPQAAVPVAVGGVEVAGGVALSAGADAAAAVRGELVVEQRRHRLVRRGPFGVAAAEHAVRHTVRRAVGGARDPPAERGGVVRGSAVVGRADDEHGAVAGQVVDVVVERPEGHGEPALGALLRQPGRDRLGGAEVRAEQHRERGAVPVDVRGGHRSPQPRPGWPRPGLPRSAVDPHAFPGPDEDVEVVGLDRERGLRLELVVQVVDELEALHQHAEHQQRLLDGELPPDARPRAGAEGLVGVRRDRRHPLGGGVVGVELVGVRAPDLGVQVQRLAQHQDRGVRRDGVPAADHRVLVGLAGEAGRRGPQPQGLVEDLPDVASGGATARTWARRCCRTPRRPRRGRGPGRPGC